MGISRLPDTLVSLLLFFSVTHYPDTWVSPFLFVLQIELFPTLSVVQGGQLFMCLWIIGTSGLYSLSLPSVGGDTHRDNSVKYNLLIEYWLTRISLACVLQCSPSNGTLFFGNDIKSKMRI